MTTGGDRFAKGSHLPGGSSRGRVLDRPTNKRDLAGRRVEQLDEVVLEWRIRISAAPIHLTDRDLGRRWRRRGRGSRRWSCCGSRIGCGGRRGLGVLPSDHGDVVDAYEFITARGVSGNDPDLDQGLIVGVGGQHCADGSHRLDQTRAVRRVCHVRRVDIREASRRPDSVLERDRLNCVVVRIDVAQVVRNGDVGCARGVEIEHDVRRVRRA